ncbi:zinc-binding dehydrogenase [Tsukamurella strandjordii]|uniref:zinc-binding dehydrogenase n=1 Tax=Tsukamurella TaxID=2060 RepID=UPI001C7CACA4|nr:zinc-binding dehydrogenase [Tsukamurella sp. TY48]GIZ95818.1 oxidoreductase/dehydrogenase [Tsukamurella sp. TY48]
MRALMHDEFGDPATVLSVKEIPAPEPRPGQVLIRTLLASIHNHDLWTVKGDYGYKPTLPARSGSEAVGVIEALGEGVTGLSVGQRVMTGGAFGTWAEYFVANADTVLPVPDAIPDEAAAQLFAMPFSAASLLEYLQVQPGGWIVQNAANGMVGGLLAQLAAARGVNVTGLVRRSAAVEELAALGISNVIATDTPDWRERAAALPGDTGYAAAVDSVGGSASTDLARLLGQRGTLVSFGAMSAAGAGQTALLEIPVNDVIFKELTIKGFWGRTVSQEMAPAKRRELVEEIVRGAAAGTLKLPVDGIYDFDRIADAATANGRPGRSGKILLRP